KCRTQGKKINSGDTHLRRRWRLWNRRKDLNEIEERPGKAAERVDLDNPSFGQFYCIHCAAYYINDHELQAHFRTKVHKRRMNALEVEPYSIWDSLRAACQDSFVSHSSAW
ncbi:AGAP012448-PA, partial [Anopheles gambiae str. PEST]